ncbi:MAG: hypothetical protein HYX78_06465 [Armatimonadetes bacterium]|nr:hypothetical protein [Armatimonadota bacterium]
MKRQALAICVILILLAAAQVIGQDRVRPQWWPGEGPGIRDVVAGEVAAVSPTSITLETRRGLQTFTVTDQTRVVVRGEKATIADVNVGDHAIVKPAVAEDGSRWARGILVPKPRAAGKITAVTADGFTLTGREQVWNVILTAETKILSHRIPTGPKSQGYIGTPQDLRVGYHAAVLGDENGDTITAAAVLFHPMVIKGVVEQANHNEIVVRTVRQRVVTVVPTDGTVVFIRPRTDANQLGAWNDVKQGMPVNIGGHILDEGTMEALWVDLLTGGPGPGGGADGTTGNRRPGALRRR